MIGLSMALIRPKMTGTIRRVSAFAAVVCPESTIPGTSHAATPRAAEATTIRSSIFMALVLQYRSVAPGDRGANVADRPCPRRGTACGRGATGLRVITPGQVGDVLLGPRNRSALSVWV